MVIVSSIKPTDNIFQSLSLEQKALLKFLEDQKRLEREQGFASAVTSLIERGRATENLIKLVVKRRNRILFDEKNSEEENMKLLKIVEKVFETEEEVTQFLD